MSLAWSKSKSRFGPPRKGTTSKCPNCGVQFYIRPSHAKTYCSRVCQNAGKRILKVCVECGRQFQYRMSENEQNCCSLRCRRIHGGKTVNCANCGKGIRRRNSKLVKHRAFYCSRECQAEHLFTKPKTERHKNNISIANKNFWLNHPFEHPLYKMGFSGQRYPFVSKGQYELFLKTREVFPDALLNQPLKTSTANLYYPDIMIPSIRTIIEYDGRHWHHNRAKDKIRDFNLQSDRWKVFHVRDDESDEFKPERIWIEDRIGH